MKLAPRNPVLDVLSATVAAGTAGGGGVKVDLEVALAKGALDELALGDRGEHVDIALGEMWGFGGIAMGAYDRGERGSPPSHA